MKKPVNINYLLVIWVTLVLFLVSCGKDDIVPEPESEPVIDENPVVEKVTSKSFIYDIFKEKYFWYDKLPVVDPDSYSSNEALVNALRYSELDRWSFVADLDEYLALFEEGETKGFGVGLAWLADDRMMVRFTYDNSQMGLAGVQRGWEIYKIDGLTIPQISDLNAAFDQTGEVDFTFITNAKDTVDRTMIKGDYIINTVLHRSVIDTLGVKVGYLVFESFLEPSYDELDEAFAYFKKEGVNELVVDLRYNGGGSLGAAVYLAGLVGGTAVEEKLMGTILYNSKRQDENIPYGVSANNLAVNIDHLYFITAEGTASASELVINDLFPFKDVTLIGERTHGKPVGMEVDTSQVYNIAVAPITFKLTNALGDGDYFDGIPVDYEVADDIFHNWGDPEEACLKQALGLITGQTDAIALKSVRVRPVGLPLKRGLQEVTGAY